MKPIKVINLASEVTYTYYHCTPEKAVIQCYLYNNGNINTWEYDDIIKKEKKNLTYGKYTVAYHDYTAFYK